MCGANICNTDDPEIQQAILLSAQPNKPNNQPNTRNKPPTTPQTTQPKQTVQTPQTQQTQQTSYTQQTQKSITQATLQQTARNNQTTTQMSFVPTNSSNAVNINNQTLQLPAGTYNFTATFDYPQLTQLSVSNALNPPSQGLITQDQSESTSLSFLSYTTKLLAGGVSLKTSRT